MKRRKQQNVRRSGSGQATGKAQKPAKKMSRRELLGMAKFYGAGAAIVGLGGWYFAGKVMAGIHETDLSRLGNGIPAIVQVHDPQCPSCRALQRQTRLALEEFDDGTFEYVIANLDSPEGRAFADQYQAGRVTLILFDGRGKMRNVIQGQRTKGALVDAFNIHLRRSNAVKPRTG